MKVRKLIFALALCMIGLPLLCNCSASQKTSEEETPVSEKQFITDYNDAMPEQYPESAEEIPLSVEEETPVSEEQFITDYNDTMSEQYPESAEEIPLSVEEMKEFYAYTATYPNAFAEKLYSELSGDSGVKFGVVNIFNTEYPQLFIAKPIDLIGRRYSIEIFIYDKTFISCGTIEGNNLQYSYYGDTLTSYTDFGSADGRSTSVRLECYDYDGDMINLIKTYNYTLQYIREPGFLRNIAKTKTYTVTSAFTGKKEF